MSFNTNGLGAHAGPGPAVQVNNVSLAHIKMYVVAWYLHFQTFVFAS
jgi:hypothetical protein